MLRARAIVFVVLMVMLVLTVTGAGLAQQFPQKPVTVVTLGSPGSAADMFARTLAGVAEKYLGKPIVVENRPGGGGAASMASVRAAQPDGYTLLQTTRSSSFLLAGGQLPFGPDAFIYLVRGNADPSALLVRSQDGRFGTVKEFVAYAKAHPGTLKVGGAGTGSFNHFVAVKFMKEAGIVFSWIPYNSGSDALLDLLGGRLDAMIQTPGNALGQIKAGQVRVLAITTENRSPFYPDVPTFKEEGYAIVELNWRGILAPAGVPEERLRVLEQAFTRAMQDPEWATYLTNFQQEDAFLPRSEFGRSALEEIEATREFLKSLR
ncbi:MAG: tripartite tricarboxylate transporter substrate binding protein [Bacillota bacterium]